MSSEAAPEITITARVSHLAGMKRWKAALTLSLRYLFLLVFGVIFILPYAYMFLSALKPQAEIFQFAFPLSWRTFIPQDWTLENIRQLFQLVPYPFTRYFMNSIIVAVSTTLGALVVNAMAAYAFARLEFPGKRPLFAIFLLTVMIPFEILAIPMYLQMRNFEWINTYQALIIPWIANAAGIFLLRQFFMEIPKDLIDAARIDGCNHFTAFWNVVVPNAVPALITFSLIRFQASWDAFFWPLIVAPSPEMRVVQVAIATFTTEVETRWGLTFASSALATLPILLAFLFLQRYYIRGVLMSGLKG
jgi:multiple sugar transport system permease protein